MTLAWCEGESCKRGREGEKRERDEDRGEETPAQASGQSDGGRLDWTVTCLARYA